MPRFGLIGLVALFAASAAFAQTGSIQVAVTDAEGAPLPGATVTISHETGSVKTTAVLTDEDGLADFPVLRPGRGYAVTVAFPGYGTIREDSIRVAINNTVRLPIRMVEEFTERVKVTAERNVIDLEQTEQTTRFSEDFIADLPVAGRFYQNVLTMAPGVQDKDGDGNPNVHGSRSRDFKAVVSGVSNVDPLTGQWMSNVNPNSIEEMEIVTAGAGVEFGRAQGGFARIIQKQGSNTHEGIAEFYWRTSKLDGNGEGNRSNLPDPDFDWLQPAVQLSGPVVKDNLWYRVSLEDRDIERPVVTGNGTEITTFDEETRDVQLTWQVSPRNKLALNYRADPRLWKNLGVSSTLGAESSLGREWNGETTSLTWTAPYSPKVLVESTVAYSDLNFREFPNQAGKKNECVTGQPWLEDAYCFDVDTARVTGSYPITNDDRRQRLTVSGKATVYGGRFLGVSHEVKAGIQAENERYFRALQRSPNIFKEIVVDPDRAADAGQNDPGFNPFVFIQPVVAVPQSDDVRATGTIWAAYLEDKIKPHRNLSLTLGVRVDHEEIGAEGRSQFDPAAEFGEFRALVDSLLDPSSPGYNPTLLDDVTDVTYPQIFTGYEALGDFRTEISAILCEGEANPTTCTGGIASIVDDFFASQLGSVRRQQDQSIRNTNFSPYLAVSWSPGGGNKTAIKAAAGRHYNNTALVIPLQEMEPTRVALAYLQDLQADPNGVLPLPRLEGGIRPNVNVSVVARDLETPYQDELTFSLERELWAETSLRLTYINRKYRDQIQDRNINLAVGDFGQCLRQVMPSDPVIGLSYGSGQTLIDQYTGDPYIDTDPGAGDGLLDDCFGDSEGYRNGNVRGILSRPDGLLDTTVQNPFWGDIFLIDNINEIDYESFVLELVRRQYRSWEMNASYTWSKAEGDGEDFFQELGDDPSLRDNQFGYQSYDQRHVVKFNATTVTPWGVRLGTSATWESGLPFSDLYQRITSDSVTSYTSAYTGSRFPRARQTYLTGERNSERNPSEWNIDLKATKEINVGRRAGLQLSAEVFNLLDDGTYRVYAGESGFRVNGTNSSTRRFGRRWQLGAKLAF